MESKTEEEEICESRDFGYLDEIMSIRSMSVSLPMTLPVEMTRHGKDDNGVLYDDDDHHDDDEEDDDDVDVDDDLVPWELKGRFGKQRITNMGKKNSGPKFKNTKKVPCYFYNRPGKSRVYSQRVYVG